jgi:hypothetical protein
MALRTAEPSLPVALVRASFPIFTVSLGIFVRSESLVVLALYV